MTTAAEMVTYACWAVAGVVWAVGALRSRQHPAADRRSERDLASPLAAIVAMGIVVSPASWWRPLTTHAAPVLAAGIVVVLLATAWTVRARVALGLMWASGIVAHDDHQLRMGGLYGVTRHPVYTGIIGMLAGTTFALGVGRWAALTVVVAVILIAKARAEERLLTASFPVEYRAYRQRVPMLVPRLGRNHP